MTPVVRRVLFGVGLSAVGSGLTMPLLIIYLAQVRGLGTAVAGLVVSYMAIASLVLLPLSGTLVDRLGPRPVLMAGLLVQGLGIALLTQVDSVQKAFAVATVVTLGGSFSWGPQSSLLGRLTSPETRERVFGIQFMLLNLGIGIGGLVSAAVVDVTDPGTFTLLYLFDALGYLLYVGVLASLRGVGVGPAPREEGAETGGGYRDVLRDGVLLRIAVLGLVLLTCGYGSLEVGLPVIVTVFNGMSITWVAVAFSVNTAGIVALQLFSLRFIAGRSRSRFMAVVAALWALSWLILGFSGQLSPGLGVAAVCLSMLVFGLGETLWAPIAPALINDLAPERLRGRYNSVQSLVWGVSGSLGPALAGLMLGAGLVGPWIGLLVAGCLVAGLLALRLRHHLTPALDGRAGAVAQEERDGTMTP